MPQIKLTKYLFTFYSLESPIEEEENLKELLLITCSKSTFAGIKKLGFICKEYRGSDKNAYICWGLARCCIQGARRKQLDRVKVFLEDPAIKFHEAATRLFRKIGYEAHHFLPADIYYQNSYYIKFALMRKQQMRMLNYLRMIQLSFFGAK